MAERGLHAFSTSQVKCTFCHVRHCLTPFSAISVLYAFFFWGGGWGRRLCIEFCKGFQHVLRFLGSIQTYPQVINIPQATFFTAVSATKEDLLVTTVTTQELDVGIIWLQSESLPV